MSALKQFFAVTRTSVYQVILWRHGGRAMKIALNGESKVPIGDFISGYILGVTQIGLVACVYGRREKPCQINTRHWSGHASPLTALFLHRKSALQCLEAAERLEWDPRWREATLATLLAITPDHPVFVIDDFIDEWDGDPGARERFRSLLAQITVPAP